MKQDDITQGLKKIHAWIKERCKKGVIVGWYDKTTKRYVFTITEFPENCYAFPKNFHQRHDMYRIITSVRTIKTDLIK